MNCKILLLATFAAWSVSAAVTVPGGNVSGIWDKSGSPYLVDGDINVPVGQTLVIEAGVHVLF